MRSSGQASFDFVADRVCTGMDDGDVDCAWEGEVDAEWDPEQQILFWECPRCGWAHEED